MHKQRLENWKEAYRDKNVENDKGGIPDNDTVDSNRTVISSEMEEEILLGQRVIKANGASTNRIRGGHSPKINSSSEDYVVEILRPNSDGTKAIKFITQFPNGKLSKIKNSTVFPENWVDADILNAVKQIGSQPPLVVRDRDQASLHRGKIDGVEIEVIKIGDDVTLAYPTGGIPTSLDKF